MATGQQVARDRRRYWSLETCGWVGSPAAPEPGAALLHPAPDEFWVPAQRTLDDVEIDLVTELPA